MRGPRLRLRGTLRARLIAGLVALLATACAAVGVASYLATRTSLLNQSAAQVQTATGLWYACLASPASAAAASQGAHPRGGGTPAGYGWTAGTQGVTLKARVTGPANPSDQCMGLGPGTLEATISGGRVQSYVVASGNVALTPADEATLLALRDTPMPPAGQQSAQPPTYVRTLNLGGSSLRGSYLITAIKDSDGTSACITGIPLAGMYHTLHDLAVTELLVFGSILMLAIVLGTAWVRLSLRPLRRVAATAAQVAELPLESGAVELPSGVPDSDPRTETGQVGAAFNRMLGHVQNALARRNASEQRLRQFAADASHELRTPLSAIRGYAELALRRPGDSPPEVVHALRRVVSESTRMSVLVDDLLLLARLDAGRPLAREPVDMSRMAIDATSDARAARPCHRWVLDLPDDEPVMVVGDELRLHQVLANLLSNAGRHTCEGTVVTVRLCNAATAGDSALSGAPAEDGEAATVRHGVVPALPRMELTVADDGPGIPASLLPELFERFTRADTARSRSAGAASTGLGLAIVDAVVAAHQGCVEVASRAGMTRFTIALPLLAPAQQAGPREPAEQAAAGAALARRRRPSGLPDATGSGPSNSEVQPGPHLRRPSGPSGPVLPAGRRQQRWPVSGSSRTRMACDRWSGLRSGRAGACCGCGGWPAVQRRALTA